MESRDDFPRQASVLEIAARRAALRRGAKLRGEKLLRDLVDFVKRRAQAGVGIGSLRAPGLPNRHANLFRHLAERLRKRQILDEHHELEDVASHAAAETVEDLLDRMNRERRGFLLMERAQAHPVGARLSQLDVVAEDANDVRRRPDFIHFAHD